MKRLPNLEVQIAEQKNTAGDYTWNTDVNKR